MISDLLRVVPRRIIVVIILDRFRPAVIMQLASLGVKLRRSRYAEVITGRKITPLALKELSDSESYLLSSLGTRPSHAEEGLVHMHT